MPALSRVIVTALLPGAVRVMLFVACPAPKALVAATAAATHVATALLTRRVDRGPGLRLILNVLSSDAAGP
jgi:hypothetical protein